MQEGHSPAVAAPSDGERELNGGAANAYLLEDDDEPFLWDRVAPRRIDTQRWATFGRYMGEIFQAFGMDLDTPGTRCTPERFLRALFDSTSGYEGDPNLVTAFPAECRGDTACRLSQVIEGPIHFYSVCEHHALPFFGIAHVGYVPQDLIIGISKLTRLVRLFARRFTVQERMGVDITETLVKLLDPHGVAVHLAATHLCTQMRGVEESQSKTWTSFWRGSYETEPAMRDEFLRTVGGSRR
jgi:GTP cyclohydrolase I